MDKNSELVVRGLDLLAMADWESALAVFEDVLSRDASSHRAICGRGVISHKRGQLQSAMADYDRALRINPEYAEAHFNRALILIEQEHIEEAIEALELAISLEREARFVFHRGRAYREKGQLEDSIVDFTECINASQNSAERALSFFQRGVSLTGAGRLSEALDDLRKAIDLNENLSLAYQWAAFVSSKLNLHADAIRYLDCALKLTEAAWSYCLRGRLKHKLRDYEAAIEDFNSASEMESDRSQTYLYRGKPTKVRAVWMQL